MISTEVIFLKTICIVAGCYNEKGNISELYRRFKAIFEGLSGYDFKLLLIDNKSTDGTRQELEQLCREDKRVQAIFNTRNFGHVRSPFYGILQAEGDAIFTFVSDLQVDPEIIRDFIPQWEKGHELVIGIKSKSEESFILKAIRNCYYYLFNRLSETPMRKNFIGIGLYDQKVINAIRTMKDPYPYFRGMVFEVGYKIAEVYYHTKPRKKGITKNNFFTLYDVAMLGICSHSKIPLRLATFSGFACAMLALAAALFYFIYKIIYWNSFRIGMAPLVIGLFFFSSVQLIFLGVIGEYIGLIFTKVENRPLVFEEKRMNF